jgi:protein-L-isoaspartate(D-aspartate) O-methyltransferase
MVEDQIERRGVRDPAVLEALRVVPREAFVPEHVREHAFDDRPLPIGAGQTISQPYVVGLMAEALELRPGNRVLEVGAGSGYVAAVLSRIVAEVVTVERSASLATAAAARLAALGYDNVRVMHGDGTRGYPARAPYDAISVAAAARAVPDDLRKQLAEGGRLVIPVGAGAHRQELLRLRRSEDGRFAVEELGGVRFVPLIGGDGNGMRAG